MNIQLRYVEAPEPIPQSSIRGYRQRKISLDAMAIPPTWGKVLEVYSDSTADVELTSGAKLPRIAVAASGYVADQKDMYDDKVLGGKRLPPKGARVLILFPDGIQENAIIIASGFMPTSKNQTAELLADDEAKIDRTRNEAGLLTEYDQEDGVFTLKDADTEDFVFTFSKKDKKITLVDWSKNKVTIDEDGIVVEDTNGNKITRDSNGMILEDKNGNTITQDSSGMKLEDKNGNNVTMGTASVTINSNFEVLQ
jgi:hypothetical protein